jgi:TolB-like protein
MPNKISQFWSKLKRRKVLRVISVFAAAAFVIVALIILNIIPGNNLFNKKGRLDKTIVVLPFINDSSNEESMYIDISIIENLARIENLKVISSTSAAHYRNSPKPIIEIAEELNVRFVLEGSVIEDGDNIRVTIQLIDALNDRHLWANTYDKRGEELRVLLDEISQLVAEEIEAAIIPKE